VSTDERDMSTDKRNAAVEAWLRARITQARSEIVDDMIEGIVPASVRDFSTLHSHVDANEYGGLCDETVRATFPAADDVPSWAVACNHIQQSVHGWLAEGGALADYTSRRARIARG